MFTLEQPRKIVFRNGCLADLGPETAALGRRALIVCGARAMAGTGILPRAQAALQAAGLAAVVYDRVAHDPSYEVIEDAAATARREGCDTVIGLGGGSSMDAAKAAALLATNPWPVRDFAAKKRSFDRPGLPFLAVPTTAGSGAEVTRNAVLTDAAAGEKKSLRGAGMGAVVALVDPELTLSMPPSLTAETGMDALTQAIEAYLCKDAHAVSDALAQQGVRCLFPHLERAYVAGGELRWREPVMLGSLLAGMAFSNAALGAVHGLAHPLGCRLGLPHGFLCAVLLPHVLEFNRPACEARFADLAGAMGLCSGAAVADAVRALNGRLGLPATLAGHGLTAAHFPVIVAQCRSRSMEMNPRAMSDDDVTALLQRLL